MPSSVVPSAATVPPTSVAGPNDEPSARFAVVVPGASLNGAFELAEGLRRAVARQSFVFDGVQIPVTLSLGVCQRLPGESAAELYERTDRSLYAAKHAGRNCVRAG